MIASKRKNPYAIYITNLAFSAGEQHNLFTKVQQKYKDSEKRIDK